MSSAWHLKQIKLFEMLPAKALQRLADAMDDRIFERGARVFNGNDAGGRLYFLKRGRVKLSRFAGDGRELVLAVIEAGEVFGEQALTATGAPQTVCADAIETSDIGIMSLEDFDRLLREFPSVSFELSRLISERLDEAHRRMADLVFKNIAGRVAGLLLTLLAKHGVEENDRIVLDCRITHQEIANRIGSTRETVTATLGDFRRRGYLSMRGRKLVIHEPRSLERIYTDNSA